MTTPSLGILDGLPLAVAAQLPPRGAPAFLVNPTSDLDRAFRDFHRANPEFYWEVERRALALVQNGATRIGMAMIFESIRYDATVGKLEGAAFKANNSYRAYYARLLMHDHEELKDVIEIRHQRERAA